MLISTPVCHPPRQIALELHAPRLLGVGLFCCPQGLIEELAESPDPSNTDERRRYYRLTRFGRRVAAAEVERLNALVKQARETGLVPSA